MQKKVVNVVMGILDNANCRKLKNNFGKILEKELGPEFSIGVIDFVYTKKDFNDSLASLIYNYGIIMEKIGEDAIGQGALKKWKKEYPETRIILLMNNDKKGSPKANGLFDRDYFDGLFLNDLGKLPMVNLFHNSRKKEDAYIYYDIEAFEEKERKRKEQKELEFLEKQNAESSEELNNNSAYVTIPAPSIKASSSFGTKYGTLELMERQLDEELIEESNNLEKSIDVNSIEITNAEEIETESEEQMKSVSEIEEDIENINAEENANEEYENKISDASKILKDEIEEHPFDSIEKESLTTSTELKKDSKDIKVDTVDEKENVKNTFVKSKDDSQKKQKKNVFDVNKVKKQINIDTKLDDDEYLKGYISSCTKEAERDHKASKDYKLIKNLAFIDAIDEYSFRSEVALNELIKLGKASFGQFVVDQLGKLIKESKVKKNEKEIAQDMFYDFCFEYDILNSLIRDENISDIHVVNYDTIRVKQNGERKTSLMTFYSEKHYTRFVKNLILRHDNSFSSKGLCRKYVDKDFSNKYVLSVTIIEESINNHNIPELIISKSFQNKIPLEEMIGKKFTLQQAAIILNAIQTQKGILFCGPNKCGATTVVNALLEYIPKWKSAIVLQHSDELFVKNHPEITTWHPIIKRGQGDITIEKLCEAALDLDVDYFILGDTKGKEAISLYKSLMYGFTPWTVVRASSCENAFDNLENMILDTQPNLDRKVVREILKSKFEVAIYMEEKNIVEFCYEGNK